MTLVYALIRITFFTFPPPQLKQKQPSKIKITNSQSPISLPFKKVKLPDNSILQSCNKNSGTSVVGGWGATYLGTYPMNVQILDKDSPH